MVAIDIQNVVKRFAPTGKAAVGDGGGVNLRVESGELFFLLGPSGCGKTTLLRMVAGLIAPTSGQILFDQQNMANVPAHQRDTAMVFQGYALWPHMTVAANIAFGLDVRKIKDPERGERINNVLALVQMADFRDRKPAQLSGGQQQRVALARALAIRPRALLFDEPLSNLDAQIRLQMRSEIRRIVKGFSPGAVSQALPAARAGITSIYVTHDQKEALSMADRIGVMDKGQLVQVGTPVEIYRQPATRFVAGFIGESNFMPGRIREVTGHAILIETSAGVLFAEAPASAALTNPALALGSEITLAIRPESLRIATPADPPRNRLRGRRMQTTYLGEVAEHTVALDGQIQLRATEINPRPAPAGAPGDAIEITVDPDQVMLVRD